MAGGDRATGQQPAAAAWHQQIIERAGVLDQLLRRRTLPGDDVRMIERRNHRHAAAAREFVGDRLARIALAVVEHHLGAIAARALGLHRRRIVGHDDDGRDAEQSAGERHRLRVVARGIGDHAAPLLLGRQAGERVVGAAELERAAALQVLAFEKHAGAGALIDGARSQHRRAMGYAGERVRRCGDVVVCDWQRLRAVECCETGHEAVLLARGAVSPPRIVSLMMLPFT